MITGVPIFTCSKSHSADGIAMRMHPWDAEYPREAASGVPWIPTEGELMPIQRVPSGLPGPGGTWLAPLAQGDGGGYHQGFRDIWMILNVPSGVGYAAWPVATLNTRTTFSPS